MRFPDVFGVTIIGGVAFASFALAAPPELSTPKNGVFAGSEYVLGSPKARITLIEYGSTTCPHCASFDMKVFPVLRKRYIDTGQLRYVFREFLTPPAVIAAASFLLARCAGPNKYFGIVEETYRRQDNLLASESPKKMLLQIAAHNGLTDAESEACLTNKIALNQLNDRVEYAEDHDKVAGTPTFFINGKRLDRHGKEASVEMFDKAFEPMLKRR